LKENWLLPLIPRARAATGELGHLGGKVAKSGGEERGRELAGSKEEHSVTVVLHGEARDNVHALQLLEEKLACIWDG
jgi:hypothetical protein